MFSPWIKRLLSPEEVQARMVEIKRMVVDGEFTADGAFNGDGTGMLFGAPPITQYEPHDADRATSPEGDEKACFTSFVWGSVSGKIEPSFNIVKCTSKNSYDMSSTRNIQNMYAATFTPQKGWTLGLWPSTLTLSVKKRQPLLPCANAISLAMST
ncbi:MAG: hypothetical protein SGPRY_006686, partial [Prymnesium sp.]